ncbi:MAG: 30S ribosomal protein S12 methylthiotransferase RimO [Bacteroidales bacterium]|jgi:ribosomal protein S12 methylthiotransferase|nr:30S ribosomal protein S12 methylthiotransferase RimO [Bacteroidales bacterium]
MKVSVITLGCSKNVVDSEKLAGILDNYGLQVTFESIDKADIAIINTCGFILDAKEESVDTILDCVRIKNDKRYKLSKLYVFGCLVERNKKELQEAIPEVDGWFGVNNIETLSKSIVNESKNFADDKVLRLVLTPNHYAYLKIAEGCNKKCAFCAIPLIRGKHISRTKEDILSEAKFLVDKGVKELILISQDLTYYGLDLYKSIELRNLVQKISGLGFSWIRLHYAHPNEINEDFIKIFNEFLNVCKYLDIPLQHISSPILKRMKRNINKEETIALVKRIKEIVPDIAIRTAFIVGFPGETEEEFEELVEFVKESQFDRVGVFTFSSEEGTAAADMLDDVPDEVKQLRKDRLLEVQQDISLKKNQEKIGSIMKVIIDSKENDYYIGRTEFDSPEVDNEVIVFSENNLEIGEFYDVLITDADYFDLIAEIPNIN